MTERTITVKTIETIMDYCISQRWVGNEADPLYCHTGMGWLRRHEVITLDDACEDMYQTDYFLWTVYMYTEWFELYRQICRVMAGMSLEAPVLRNHWDDVVAKLEQIAGWIDAGAGQ